MHAQNQQRTAQATHCEMTVRAGNKIEPCLVRAAHWRKMRKSRRWPHGGLWVCDRHARVIDDLRRGGKQ